MLSAIVLAAGSSKRMNQGNKLLLPVKNKTVLETTLDNILAAGPGEVIVVLGKDAEGLRTSLLALPVSIVYNPDHEMGITSSIKKGVGMAGGNGYMICLADMILISSSEYALLMDAFENRLKSDPQSILVPSFNQVKGNPVIFSSFYKNQILEHKDPEGCKEIVRSNLGHSFQIAMPTNHVLQDLDTQEDYERIQAL
jgi:molybdenum cofactor cytidylyltransferase